MAGNPREDGGAKREPRNAAGSVAVTRVALRNYRSIAACDVALPPLTFLVGPNGSGKSNFLDALRFIAQALRFSPEHALRERGGINEVRRRSRGHPNHFAVRVDFRVPDAAGHYAFEIGARPRGRYFVRREHCFVRAEASGRSDFFRMEDGRRRGSSMSHPPPTGGSDRLYLLPASTYKAFRPVYDTLAGMGFYNLNPARIRELQSPGPGDLLDRDGGNVASVLERMKSDSPSDVERIGQYLASVVPGTHSVEPRTVGPKLTLEFRQRVRGDPNPWRFLANNVSDGTLRALGVLAALFQGSGASRSARVVGIEEPETALHPAAAGVLADVLHEASRRVQVVVTSHGADLLDRETIPLESILAVVSEDGETKVSRPDEAGRVTLRDGLFTVGELLRMNQLAPDASRH